MLILCTTQPVGFFGTLALFAPPSSGASELALRNALATQAVTQREPTP